MSNLNRDILYLIFEELKDDGKDLFSCLLINKICTNIIIPILWKNPWKYLREEKNNIRLLKVIISHLSNESKNNLKNLKNQNNDNYDDDDNNNNNLIISYQKPLFDYISFCKYLNFKIIIDMINSIFNINDNNNFIIINEIFNLFINENMKFTHLYIPKQFYYKIHLISGFDYCFSGLKFLQFDLDNNNQNILEGLVRISNSIKNLEFIFYDSGTDMNGIIKLIEAQKELCNVYYFVYHRDRLFRISFEESLIKHADTIQYLKIDDKPITKLLSYLVNLISIEMDDPFYNTCWNHLENISLPNLKFLKAKRIPLRYLAKLIENTKGKLCEISINSLRYNDFNYEELIQVIIKNCLNLKYLTLVFRNGDIMELEKLLINCQYLNGLIIVTNKFDLVFDWNKLFEILIKNSPISLFKFKFYFYRYRTLSQLDSLNLFFEKWKGRYPMLLQTVPMYSHINLEKYFDIIEKYKSEGIIKKYDNDLYGNTYDEFEWIKERF
ncbi:hypothetical protein RhiirA1_465005 [Rhizophagus irregularis]|uniref:Uncharacterized protein n=1 Tax=Rhizophagus irregularis TaxID=588596 RepID=A0A2I1EMI6_9GLOM|nr:hypothetical protein RhiirA1_465005 [Rhizophagus irregularis]PKY23315.1 hypothetical protein RhiirB3_437501 [Rhizophagus irregularis]